MAKKTYAEMKELKTSQVEEAKQAKKDFKKFCKENKIDVESTEPPKDEKVAKKWSKLKGLVEKTEKALAETEKWLSENKPKKESKPRSTKYEYPAEVQTAADKKKYRAKMRAQGKKKDKEKKGEGTESAKSDKKGKKAKEEKTSKKDKKAKKDKSPESTQAED